MVDKIYEIKNKVLGQIEQDMREKGPSRIDGDMVDMVKDLAEAEKCCWEAEYYRSVVEAMGGGSGYGMSGSQMGYDGMYGMQQGTSGMGGRTGSQSGYRDSQGRYARRGYGGSYQEHIDALKAEMQGADPQQRDAIAQELRKML